MNKQKTVKQLSERLEELSEVHTYPNCMYDVFELDYETAAETLVNEGWGNVRRYRQTLIELYLKGKTVELLKFIMEEV